MARPKSAAPTATLRRRGKSFQLRWHVSPTQYELSLGAIPESEAKAIRAVATAALAGRADWPDEIVGNPTVRRYLLSMQEQAADGKSTSDLIERYIKHMRAHSESAWPVNVKSHLTRYFQHVGSLDNANAHNTMAFLDSIAENLSVATRNRALVSISGFCRWLKETKTMPKSWEAPCAGARIRGEERPESGITILEPKEIESALAFADTRRDGLSVWVAIYAGLRRGEIVRLLWRNIHPAFIDIVKSKTKKKRQVPLAEILKSRLDKYREKHKPKPDEKVVPWPGATNGWEAAARDILNIHMKKHAPNIPCHKRGWNVFRHTFASRHAQHGIPIDVIAAWLGDSPKVCREHYARYVPENMKDKRIDYIDQPSVP